MSPSQASNNPHTPPHTRLRSHQPATPGEPMRRAAIATVMLTLALAGCASPTAPEPSATTTVSPACRAWIAGELQDGTLSVDDAAGYTACGDIPQADLDQAVDEVLAELLASAAAQ